MDRPWWKFYGRDWLGDLELHRCSLAAQGLWANMLCLMNEGEPYGHLTSKGVPISVTELSFICRVPASTINKLIAELESQSVFSKTSNGVIFSRRMVKDERERVQSNARKERFNERSFDRSERSEERSLNGSKNALRASDSDSSSEKEKKDELFSLDEPPFDPPWEEEVERVTERIWKRHGAFRRCARDVVKSKLRTICMDVPEPERVASLQYIDFQHEKMKRSEDWTKDGGAYIKGLDAWLNPKNRLWENEPRSSVKVEAHNPYRLVDSLGEGGAT